MAVEVFACGIVVRLKMQEQIQWLAVMSLHHYSDVEGIFYVVEVYQGLPITLCSYCVHKNSAILCTFTQK